MSLYLRIILVVQFLVACSQDATMTAKGKVAGQKQQDSQVNSDASAETNNSEMDNDEAVDDKTPAKELPPVVPGSYLACTAEYTGLPASAPQAQYGCRLESAGKRVEVPSTAMATLELFAGKNAAQFSLVTPPAGSPWQWMLQTPAQGPFTAQLTLANVTITNSPLAITAGTEKFRFEASVVQGSALVWVANAGVASLVSDGQTLRTPAVGAPGANTNLSFTTAFPRYITVNRAAGKTSPLILGFTIGTDFLTCRYFMEPAVPLRYVINLTTCRKGPTAQSRIDSTPVRNDLNNAAIAWKLDDLVVGATSWYTDIVAAVTATDDPGAGFVPTANIREFKAPTP